MTRPLARLSRKTAIAALTEFGRQDGTAAILTAMKKLPRRWELEMQEEINALNGEDNPDNRVELRRLERAPQEAADLDLELEDIDLATELLLTPLEHAETEECKAKCQNMQLAPVPKPLEDELRQYAAFRSSEFCRFRTGGQVVSTTVESDRAK